MTSILDTKVITQSKGQTGGSRAAARGARRPNAKSGPEASAAQAHFTAEGLKFLRGLKRNNSRDWFEPRKPIYEREIKKPMLALITAITSEMESFAPAHVRAPQKCMLRIYRDTRFSADKSPYKKHMAAWWTRTGLEKTSGAGFYLHVAADEVFLGAGVYMPEPAQLLAIRTWLVEHHAEFRRLLEDRKLRRSMDVFEGMPLTRSPKGFPSEHPAADLFRCRQWGVSTTLPAEAALETSLAAEIVRRFRLAAPLVDALNTPLISTPKASRKRLFPLY